MHRVQKRKVTFAQAMIFLWAAGLFFGALLLLRFVYGPLHRDLVATEEKVFFIERRLNWLNEIIASAKDSEHVTGLLVKAKQELGRKFPETEQRSLAMISEYANKFRVQMVQIQFDTPQVFKDSRGKKVVADQKTCFYVHAAVKLRADYMNFVKYLEALNKVLPAYLTLERLEIVDRSPAVPRLEVNAELALYLLER